MLRDSNMLAINKWLVSKYQRGGRKYPYLDCWGLVCDVYKTLGVELPEFTDLCQHTMEKGAEECFRKNVFKQVEHPSDLCLVVFFYSDRLFHVGIYYDGKLLHTNEEKNCVLEDIKHMMRFASKSITVRYYLCSLLYTQEKT